MNEEANDSYDENEERKEEIYHEKSLCNRFSPTMAFLSAVPLPLTSNHLSI
jgi:hypothetical protein